MHYILVKDLVLQEAYAGGWCESTYMEGNSRRSYKVRGDIDAAQKPVMSPNSMPEQVCYTCINPLSRVKEAFIGLKRQGSEIN